MKRLYITVSIILAAVLSGAQETPRTARCPGEIPPQAAVLPGDHLSSWAAHDILVGTPQITARVEAITYGIRLNWLDGPPLWALAPENDVIYSWSLLHRSYCRYLSTGPDRTSPESCATDCLSLRDGGMVYQVIEWQDREGHGEWVVVVEKMLMSRRGW